MRLFSLIAAAAVAVTGVAPVGVIATADAQQRVVVRERTVVTQRPRYRARVHTRRVCNTRVRHGHRERVCRTVRTRR